MSYKKATLEDYAKIIDEAKEIQKLIGDRDVHFTREPTYQEAMDDAKKKKGAQNAER